MADYGSEELFMDMLLHNFPKTKHPYDTITMGMILAPSFASIICCEKIHVPTLLSDLVTMMLVSWVVRFFSNWPERWVKHLKQVRTSLLNFVNLVKIEIGLSFYLPEMALNRRIFISNLVVAQKLMRLEQIAWLGGIGGTLAGAALMLITRKYLISADIHRSEVFLNSTILLYVVWSFFKLALQYLDALKASITFAKTTTAESCITENNLSYYIEMFARDSPIELPTMSPKKPKEEPLHVEQPFTPKKLNMKPKPTVVKAALKPATKPKKPSRLVLAPEALTIKPKSCFSDSKESSRLDNPKSVSFTPFPLTGTSFRKRDDSDGILSPIVEDYENSKDLAGEVTPTRPPVKELKLPEKPKLKAEVRQEMSLERVPEEPYIEPSKEERHSGRISLTGVTIPESNPSFARQQFRELHLRDMSTPSPLSSPSLPMLPVKVYRSEGSDSPVVRMNKISDLRKQKTHDDWTEVRSRLTQFKENWYESAWQYADTAWNMDTLELFTFWFFASVFIFTPLQFAFRMFVFFFKLPLMAVRLYTSITLFIPMLLFKLTIVAPARFLVKFMEDASYKNISLYEYRILRSLPLLRDRVTLKVLRKFLMLLQVEIDESGRSHPTQVEGPLDGSAF